MSKDQSEDLSKEILEAEFIEAVEKAQLYKTEDSLVFKARVRLKNALIQNGASEYFAKKVACLCGISMDEDLITEDMAFSFIDKIAQAIMESYVCNVREFGEENFILQLNNNIGCLTLEASQNE